ncbi:MAG TPA: universal stress protein, partial [Polyangiaceae bacterium]|nr:universal stress protein [Polyangiaceae bacterium]
LSWAAGLRAIAPCDVICVHVAWPLAEHVRLGMPAVSEEQRLDPQVRQIVERDLGRFMGELSGTGSSSSRVVLSWGRPEAALVQVAEEEHADLLVVGTHQRSLWGRFWYGSVSRGVLQHATMSVACVSATAVHVELPVPSFKRVLVTTDFSDVANRAIPYAYALAGRGGVVHLLHVVTHKLSASDPDPRVRLLSLVPSDARERSIESVVDVIEGEDAASGIWHAAERLAVDAVCMASHGRTGLVHALVGSQAEEVMRRCRCPVLLVPPERARDEV